MRSTRAHEKHEMKPILITVPQYVRHAVGGFQTSRNHARLAKLLDLAATLPEASSLAVGERHIAFRVGKKTFAYYMNDHHGDGVVAVCCKAAPARQQELVTADPRRYLVPAYLGKSGWVSIRLDVPSVDWSVVLQQFVGAFRMQAPKRLLAQLD